ncbi:hypothetical protein L1987_30051 [Smallanthus sonchifolius]|uniref:Uncharacterized protein n=1 Tax=Smallanthus sonchifolius TaxID=185202 RepID=A0ACB9I2Y1_9ASTR|nr:hypothetical protein L1987_30051 [Smallanthus sonchifolius]
MTIRLAYTATVKSTFVSGTFMSLFDEYGVNTEFNNTAEVNLSKVKQVVIVATVELIPPEIPWYYQSCKTCNRKLTKINDGGDISDTELVDQHVLYECKTASLESTDDNVTPLSQTEQGDGKSHVGKEATFKRKSKNPDFKRKLVDAYDIEDIGAFGSILCLNNIHNNLPTSPNYGTGGNVMEILNDNQSISYQHTNVTFSDVHIRSPLSDITNDVQVSRFHISYRIYVNLMSSVLKLDINEQLQWWWIQSRVYILT